MSRLCTTCTRNTGRRWKSKLRLKWRKVDSKKKYKIICFFIYDHLWNELLVQEIKNYMPLTEDDTDSKLRLEIVKQKVEQKRHKQHLLCQDHIFTFYWARKQAPKEKGKRGVQHKFSSHPTQQRVTYREDKTIVTLALWTRDNVYQCDKITSSTGIDTALRISWSFSGKLINFNLIHQRPTVNWEFLGWTNYFVIHQNSNAAFRSSPWRNWLNSNRISDIRVQYCYTIRTISSCQLIL